MIRVLKRGVMPCGSRISLWQRFKNTLYEGYEIKISRYEYVFRLEKFTNPNIRDKDVGEIVLRDFENLLSGDITLKDLVERSWLPIWNGRK